MKFRVTMKDPDTLYYAINEAVTEEIRQLPGISEPEGDELIKVRSVRYYEVCKAWFEYGEYLTVEINTEAKTCVVVKP